MLQGIEMRCTCEPVNQIKVTQFKHPGKQLARVLCICKIITLVHTFSNIYVHTYVIYLCFYVVEYMGYKFINKLKRFELVTFAKKVCFCIAFVIVSLFVFVYTRIC